MIKNSKLLDILRTFSKKDVSAFDKYLSSSFLNPNATLPSFFEYLKKFHPTYDQEELSKENIFKHFFTGKKYEDKKVRYLLTDLTKRVEGFIAYSAFSRDEFVYVSKLQEEFLARNCDDEYIRTYKEFKKSLSTSIVRDTDFYYRIFRHEHSHLVFEFSKQKRDDKSNMEEVLDNLDKFYLSKKLQLCCEIYNVQNVLSISYRVFLLDEILGYVSNHSFQDTPAITIYYQILMTLKESDNEEHFPKLRKLLLENESKFAPRELRDMYQFVLNYSIKKINLGDTGYQEKLFETYKIMLKNKVLLDGDFISQWDYKNIVTISLRQREYDWAKNFIHEYKSNLRPAARDNAFTYNLALLHFHKKEYSAALSQLQKVNFTDVHYQLDTRAIMLKIYFESEDHDALFYHATAFKTFIRRNRLISKYHKIIYSNLIRYTLKLTRAGGNKKKIAALKKNIEETKQIADLRWLIQKAEELS